MSSLRTFKAFIQAEGADNAEARNKILRVLAQAELDGVITHFDVDHKTVAEREGKP